MRYRRVVIPGATYFFTVNLLNRKSKLLIDEINKLRVSFRKVRKLYSFELNAIVILLEQRKMKEVSGSADFGSILFSMKRIMNST